VVRVVAGRGEQGMDTIGPWELLIVLAVVVLVFGPSRLPKMARSLGEGIREFRHAFRDAGRDTDRKPDEPAEAGAGAKAVHQPPQGQ
jgi:sec-independent protein translocase protein TatA